MSIPAHLSLAELEARGLTDDVGNPVVESVDLLPGRNVAVAPLAFGDTDLANRRMFERPNRGAWCETEYRSAPVTLYRLRNALVHSSSGIVMARVRDDATGGMRLCLLDETIQFIDLAEHGISLDANAGTFTVSMGKHTRLPRRAVHLLAPGGASNYYHWNIDVASRLSVLPAAHFDDVFLVPPLGHQFQWDLMQAVARRRPMLLQAVEASETVEVDELVLVPNVGDFGRAPRPEQLGVFDALAPVGHCEKPWRRIYVARRNADHRRLINEQEVIDLLQSARYDILECEAMPLAEQVQRFAEASHIVGPHGAGLTNVVYATGAAAICELQMDLNVNWLFRRLGNLKGMRYGCVVGENDGAWEPLSPHNKSWRVPIGRMKAALEEGGFL
ncbi:glycosyltransferase family 61 protein [Azospirillum sp. sgz302134]